MKKLASYALLTLWPFLSWGQGDTLSLSEALRIGLENNFSIRLAQQEVEITNNNVTRGNAGFLPQADASLVRNNSIQSIDQEFITGTTNERSGATSNSWAGAARLNWTVFDGMAMFTTYDKLKELQEIGELDAQIIVRNTLAEISATYFDLVQQDQLLRVMRENLALSVERVNLSKERFEIGSASRREWLLAQVDVNADSSELILQEGLLARTKTRLNQLLARDPASPIELELIINLRPEFNFEDLKIRMFSQNPALLRTQRDRALSLLELKEIQAERYPQIGVNLNYNYNRSSSEAGFLLSNRVSGINYGFSAGINLFDGFNLNRRIQNAKVQIETTALQSEQQQNELETRLLAAYLDYGNNLRLLQLERSNLGVARQNLEIARQTYELGELSSIEFREAQTNHLASENRLINALYQVKLDEITLILLSGGSFE